MSNNLKKIAQQLAGQFAPVLYPLSLRLIYFYRGCTLCRVLRRVCVCPLGPAARGLNNLKKVAQQLAGQLAPVLYKGPGLMVKV